MKFILQHEALPGFLELGEHHQTLVWGQTGGQDRRPELGGDKSLLCATIYSKIVTVLFPITMTSHYREIHKFNRLHRSHNSR
jgi:hypothetical protein